MRASVERKNLPTKQTLSFWRTHIVVVVCLPMLIAIDASVITAMNWQQVHAETTTKEAQSKQFTELDKRVKIAVQKKIDDAKKAEADAKQAEADAKAKAEADAAARKTSVAANPGGSTASATTSTCTVTDPTPIAVIVNKKHCFSPINYEPVDLVAINGFYLRSEAATHMQELLSSAAIAGVPIDFSSTYRSYDNQITTYNHWIAVNGSQAAADQVSARPGYSKHQTGLAADLKAGDCALECFGSTAQYTWLAEHASEYGFIRRYPDGLTSITGYNPEPWHWRYIGISTAKDMKTKGIQTLEEYFGVTGGDYA